MHIGIGPSAFAVEALKAEVKESNTADNRIALTNTRFIEVFSPKGELRLCL
jgi:hypothetical protein